MLWEAYMDAASLTNSQNYGVVFEGKDGRSGSKSEVRIDYPTK
jgi:hypothetical protein